MEDLGMDSRVTGDDFPAGTGGGVAFENAGYVFTQTGKHGGFLDGMERMLEIPTK
jgi:hypothetical protein